MAGGRERSQAEYATLLAAADLQLRGITPAGPVNSLIEASMPGAAL